MTDKYIIFNGKIFDKESSELPLLNRAFHYGDGLFETVRIMNGKACFFRIHFMRLLNGLKVLRIDQPDWLTIERIEEEINAICKKNKIERGGRVRLTVFRNADGSYLPDSNELSYVIESNPLPHNTFILNENGLSVDVYPDLQKQISPLSRHKTLNCLFYIQASLYAREKGLDDVLLTNTRDIIIEATSSNIFIASNKVLYTPPLEDGCTGGTMRMKIINMALENEFKVYETSLRPQNLLVADELFLTNSIFGIKWVHHYRQKTYSNELAAFLIDKLNQKAMAG